MSKSTTTVFDAAASRAIDAHGIEHLSVSSYVLMQRAAEAAFTCLLQRFAGLSSLSVCCGKGNNGGDGYLLARRAHQYGIRTQVIAVIAPQELRGDAQLAYAAAIEAGVLVTSAETVLTGEVVVDALLGTGLRGAPSELFADCINKINQSNKPVFSLDLPSGVSADSGAVFAQAVQATITISFITQKIGLFTGAGVSYVGERVFDALGMPDEMYIRPGVPILSWSADDLPMLEANTYKHRQGHVVLVGGDVNMPGAVAMAAEAALRVGAGLVTAVTHERHTSAIVARTPEVMVLDGEHELSASLLAPTALSDGTVGSGSTKLIVLGPGMGRSAWSEQRYRQAEQSKLPTVLDADGLFWLAQADSWQGGPLYITPHVAEAALLLDCTAAEVQQDRLHSCVRLRQRFQCQGVLKGAGSVVFDHSSLAICGHGNPGMATAGMGDVLSGVLGGLLAVQANSEETASLLRAGVALHSAAGDQAALKYGQRSLLATDVIAQLPSLLI